MYHSPARLLLLLQRGWLYPPEISLLLPLTESVFGSQYGTVTPAEFRFARGRRCHGRFGG